MTSRNRKNGAKISHAERGMPRSHKMNTLRKAKSPKKRERDALSGIKKHQVPKNPWLGHEAQKWYILIGLSAIIALCLFPHFLTRPKIYKLGDVAERDIKASHEFLLEDVELTEKNRREVVKDVLSVYDFDSTTTNQIVTNINTAFSEGRKLSSIMAKGTRTREDQVVEIESFKNRFFEIFDLNLDDGLFIPLMKAGFPAEVESAIINMVTTTLKNGVVSNKALLMNESGKGIILQDIHTEKETVVTNLDRFHDLKKARRSIQSLKNDLRASLNSKTLALASSELAAALIRPNLTFNKRETELRKDLARKSVKPFYIKVKKGEMLVREGERIAPEHLLKLTEQNKFLKHKKMFGRAPAMAVLIGFLIYTIYLVGLMYNRSSKDEIRDIVFNAVTLLSVFFIVLASNLVANEIARGFPSFGPRALLFAIPVACGAMLISIFQGIRVAASFSLVVSVLASLILGSRVEFFVYFFISSLVAAYGVRDCRERGVLIKTGLKLGLCNMVLSLAIEALYGSFYSVEALLGCASAFAGGVLVGIMATGILPLIEMSFGYTTDIKLLELANLDQPLLRKLMVSTPGTHHHSVIVSNMVEVTATAINANPLLAKVAAYYHDIGKMKKPLYFIENQGIGENRHEKLAPSMSSLILISHVKDGVELANKHKLGRTIVDIISQHHGTSLISYFYEKAKEQAEKKGGKTLRVKEEDYRYPGPKPQTKEAGLVMLADIVEAASRTLVDPTASRIQGMVQKIINKVFSDGQLDECELTLKDLHEIAKSFNKTLSGIFHHRVEYPESVSKSPVIKKPENGHTDHLPNGESWAKQTEDKAKRGESLKRLGLS